MLDQNLTQVAVDYTPCRLGLMQRVLGSLCPLPYPARWEWHQRGSIRFEVGLRFNPFITAKSESLCS